MRKHKKKVYYSAGLISIVLLPILCISYLIKNDAFVHYGTLNLQIWDGKEENIGTKGTTQYLNSKKYTVFNLTGNAVSDEAKLKIAQKEVRRIITSKDSIKGIKFHFEEKSEYWAFIRVLDILAIEKARFYVPYKDDIWFANEKLRKEDKNTIEIERYFVCSLETDPTEDQNKINWNAIEETAKKYFLPIVAYVLMVFLTARKIYKSNK